METKNSRTYLEICDSIEAMRASDCGVSILALDIARRILLLNGCRQAIDFEDTTYTAENFVADVARQVDSELRHSLIGVA